MSLQKLRTCLVNFLALTIICTGFGQFAFAGKIDTTQVIDTEAREVVLDRIAVALAREDVADQLASYGVSSADIEARLRGLSDEELVDLEGRLDEQLAGGDALALIGAVFLVLLILELVGVTDIFKSI